MDELPEDVAAQLGRLVYYAGHAEYYLSLLVTPKKWKFRRYRGSSGLKLHKELETDALADPEVSRLRDRHLELLKVRNPLVHGMHTWEECFLTTYHLPVGDKGNAVAIRYNDTDEIREDADRWRTLALDADRHFHVIDGSTHESGSCAPQERFWLGRED